jgi:biotin carboxyl carrier protein
VIPLPAMHVIVSPVAGRVRGLIDVDATVAPGDLVASVEGAAGAAELRAARPGRVGGLLAATSQAVDAGDGVLWVHA